MRLDKRQVDELLALGTATLHEASPAVGVLPREIRQQWRGARTVGRALPVRTPPGDNLWIHRGVYAAEEGDVIVVDAGQEFARGYWGEVLSVAAAVRGVVGLVIDACVRDLDALERVGLPVFARGPCILGTTKDPAGPGGVGAPITIGGATIDRGDVIIADRDGVVSVPRDQIGAVTAAAQARAQKEEAIFDRLSRGERTLDIYGWS